VKTLPDEEWWRKCPTDALYGPDVERCFVFYGTSLIRVVRISYRFLNLNVFTHPEYEAVTQVYVPDRPLAVHGIRQ